MECGAKFPLNVIVNGKKRNLCNRKRCLSCSPFKIPGDVVEVPARIFYDSCQLCGKSGRHRLCRACRTKVRRYKTKSRAIALLGGRCSRCGWCGDIAGFDFHHPNGDKEFNIGTAANKSWSVVEKEVRKCELLCALCHRLEHADADNPKLLAELEK